MQTFRSGTVIDQYSQFFPMSLQPPYPAQQRGDAWGYDMTGDSIANVPIPSIDGPNYDIPVGMSGMGSRAYDENSGLWIEETTGEEFTDALAPNYSTTGGNDDSWDMASITDNIRTLLLTGQQAIAQQKIIDLNMRLAQQGRPLVNAAMFQPSVGLNLQMGEQTKNLLIWGGIGLAALLLLSKAGRGGGGSKTRVVYADRPHYRY